MTFNVGDLVRFRPGLEFEVAVDRDDDGDVKLRDLANGLNSSWVAAANLELVVAATPPPAVDPIGTRRITRTGAVAIKTGDHNCPWTRLSDGATFHNEVAADWPYESEAPTEWTDRHGDVWVPNPKNPALWILTEFRLTATAESGRPLIEAQEHWG